MSEVDDTTTTTTTVAEDETTTTTTTEVETTTTTTTEAEPETTTTTTAASQTTDTTTGRKADNVLQEKNVGDDNLKAREDAVAGGKQDALDNHAADQARNGEQATPEEKVA